MLKFILFVAVWVMAIYLIEYEYNPIVEFFADIIGGVSLLLLGKFDPEVYERR